MKAFSGPDTKIEQLNEEDFQRRKKEGLNPFFDEFFWQEDLGIVLNKDSFKIGRLLEYNGDNRHTKGSYRIFIDDLKNTVYKRRGTIAFLYLYFYHRQQRIHSSGNNYGN